MDKKILMITLISVFLLGCELQSGERTQADFYKGTEGLEMKFLDNAPPDSVFPESNFPVFVEVENRGVYDIENKGGLIVLSVEKDFNNVLEMKGGFDESEIYTEKDEDKNDVELGVSFSLGGKSSLIPKGEKGFAEYELEAKKLPAQSESLRSTIFATACYPYQTEMSTTVCIDTDITGLERREKICEVNDISFSGGQGAPLAITKVETRILDKGDFVEPTFLIHVDNKGDGIVFRNDVVSENQLRNIPNENIKNVCRSGQIDPNNKDFNTLFIRASLSANIEDSNLECEPKDMLTGKEGYIRLKKDEDIIRCSLKDLPDDQKIRKNSASFTSPLKVLLDYGYTETISKSYDIEKSVVG